MLQITKEDFETRTIEVLVDGKVSKESMHKLSQEIKKRIDSWGKINVLERFVALDSVELGAIWEDLKMLKHLKGMNKIALVTDKTWVIALTNIMAAFVRPEVQIFPKEELTKARGWLAK